MDENYYDKYKMYKHKYLNLKQYGGKRIKKHKVKRQMSTKTLIYVRHGARSSIGGTSEELQAWRESERKKQNITDEPLVKKGIEESYKTGIEVAKLYKFDYIYSSPMTRCIQTSIQICDAVYKTAGKKPKIRIEYALCESAMFYPPYRDVLFDGENIILKDSVLNLPLMMSYILII